MSTVIDEVALEDQPEVDLAVLAASLRTERETPIVLALDIGTSGVRAALFDGRGDEIEGSLVALRNVSHYELGSGGDANADGLVVFVAQAIDVAVARAESFVSRIEYIAVSAFWHSLVGVDSAGRAVTPLLGWADTRAADAASGERDQDSQQGHTCQSLHSRPPWGRTTATTAPNQEGLKSIRFLPVAGVVQAV